MLHRVTNRQPSICHQLTSLEAAVHVISPIGGLSITWQAGNRRYNTAWMVL